MNLRKYKYSLFFAASLFMFTACEDDENTANVSEITYYPVFELEAGSVIAVEEGTSFTDPGVTVTEEGQPIEFQTSGSVDTSTPGFYTLTYSATNKDGFTATESRTVVVIEPGFPELDLEGTYTSNTPAFSGQSLGQEMEVEKLADGVYQATDTYAHPNVEVPIKFYITPEGYGVMENLPTSPFGLPYGGLVYFDLQPGDEFERTNGDVIEAPREADILFAVDLSAANFWTDKTWLKD